ncbi:hypothetical protein [Nocardiopsis sp. NPDC057823]|uniref:hypothetical protein n=1 Tax=Nocardiopsis sp. NPDC057823 TaxID=3346256 RepID=UPI00366C5D18
MKHTDAPDTLSRIDATLRLTDRQLWHDPEFLAWEAGQVAGDPYVYEIPSKNLRFTSHGPGPAHWLSSADAHLVGLEVNDTVRVNTVIHLYNDHHWCQCDAGGATETEADVEFRRPMRVCAYQYPEPEHTTHGPLLLGPDRPALEEP